MRYTNRPMEGIKPIKYNDETYFLEVLRGVDGSIEVLDILDREFFPIPSYLSDEILESIEL